MTKNLTIQDLINGETAPCMAVMSAFKLWHQSEKLLDKALKEDWSFELFKRIDRRVDRRFEKLRGVVNAYNECLPEALSICRDAKRSIAGNIVEYHRQNTVIVEDDYFGSMRP